MLIMRGALSEDRFELWQQSFHPSQIRCHCLSEARIPGHGGFWTDVFDPLLILFAATSVDAAGVGAAAKGTATISCSGAGAPLSIFGAGATSTSFSAKLTGARLAQSSARVHADM